MHFRNIQNWHHLHQFEALTRLLVFGVYSVVATALGDRYLCVCVLVFGEYSVVVTALGDRYLCVCACLWGVQ